MSDSLFFTVPLPTVEVQYVEAEVLDDPIIEAEVADEMIKAEVIISVPENSDTIRMIQLWSVEQDGTRTPYDLTGATQIDFFGKSGLAVTDSESFLHYTLTGGAIAVVGLPTAGVLTVQFAAADLPTPGVKRYHLDVVKAGLRTPVMAGPLVVQDL